MKINGTIEISGCDQVVINREQFFERECDTWYNTSNRRHSLTCEKMARNVKRYVENKKYKVWASGNTINIVRRE